MNSQTGLGLLQVLSTVGIGYAGYKVVQALAPYCTTALRCTSICSVVGLVACGASVVATQWIGSRMGLRGRTIFKIQQCSTFAIQVALSCSMIACNIFSPGGGIFIIAAVGIIPLAISMKRKIRQHAF